MVSALFTAFAIIAAGQAKAPPVGAKDMTPPIAWFEGRDEDEESLRARRAPPRR